MTNFRSIIEAWPSGVHFAEDVQVKYVTAQAWVYRDNIPSEYWQTVVEAAEKRRIAGVTLAVLASIAHSKRKAAYPREVAA